jgi:uncharacterized cupredoxin-like copper-binding protein
MKKVALLAVLAALVSSVVAGAVSASAATTTATKATKIRTITVIATDFHFTLKNATKLKHGVPYIFKFTNKGAALHNFDIQSVKKTKVIGHGKSQSIKVIFKKKGTYDYVCDVPRHIELGMAGTLKVS